MSSDQTPPTGATRLTSRAFEIAVDGGRDSFHALSIEGAAETEWIISDTVRALENMR